MKSKNRDAGELRTNPVENKKNLQRGMQTFSSVKMDKNQDLENNKSKKKKVNAVLNNILVFVLTFFVITSIICSVSMVMLRWSEFEFLKKHTGPEDRFEIIVDNH